MPGNGVGRAPRQFRTSAQSSGQSVRSEYFCDFSVYLHKRPSSWLDRMAHFRFELVRARTFWQTSADVAIANVFSSALIAAMEAGSGHPANCEFAAKTELTALT
jgi:hypothetical protein